MLPLIGKGMAQAKLSVDNRPRLWYSATLFRRTPTMAIKSLPPTIVCAHCGKRVKPAKHWQRFCSEACRNANHYAKKAGRPVDMSKRRFEYW